MRKIAVVMAAFLIVTVMGSAALEVSVHFKKCSPRFTVIRRRVRLTFH